MTTQQLPITTQQFITKVELAFQNQVASIKNLKTQVDQISNIAINFPQQTLPSDTEHILEYESEEYYKAITVGSGKKSSEVVTPRPGKVDTWQTPLALEWDPVSRTPSKDSQGF